MEEDLGRWKSKLMLNMESISFMPAIDMRNISTISGAFHLEKESQVGLTEVGIEVKKWKK